MITTAAVLPRPRGAQRALALHRQPGYALLATGRILPFVADPPAPTAPAELEHRSAAGGYLPRWRATMRPRPARA